MATTTTPHAPPPTGPRPSRASASSDLPKRLRGWTTVIVGTLLGLLYGSLTSTTMIALRCATRHTLIPFGPALIAGAFTGLLVPLG